MFNLLSVTWDVNPILVQLGPLAIRYYSLLFITGFPLGYWLFIKFYKREGINVDLLEPLLYALLLGTIVGARLGHCLFYEPEYYLKNPVEILKVWHGGLASHGGAIGVLLAIFWYVHRYGKKNGFDTMWLLDRLAIAVCFAGCFIRLGNLFNSEIFGGATTLPWGFKFVRSAQWVAEYGPGAYPPDGVGCHPTQIYEALSYVLLGFFLLWIYWKKSDKVYKGWIFGVFLIVLFGMRFLIEFIKNDQVGFENGMLFNMGQLLSVPFIVAGIIILVWSYRKKLPTIIVPKVEEPKVKGPRMSHAKRMAAGMKQ
ncbi:MAG: prolipoprotein diacylglyceryl transferase [Bacteroidales bacterium]|nr:prolipoprotein diacylglyceryl transferase [Bacteroidales bacterium]